MYNLQNLYLCNHILYYPPTEHLFCQHLGGNHITCSKFQMFHQPFIRNKFLFLVLERTSAILEYQKCILYVICFLQVGNLNRQININYSRYLLLHSNQAPLQVTSTAQSSSFLSSNSNLLF